MSRPNPEPTAGPTATELHRRAGASRCRSCDEPIQWARTEKGKKMPLDAAPYLGDEPAGLFVLRGDLAVATTPDAFPGEPVYRSHFATCPDAGKWRK